MLKIYNTNLENNKLEEIKEFKKGSWISLVNPSEIEIKKVCENLNIQEDFIRDALDFEEKARIDEEEDDGTILFVVDVPIIEKNEENEVYTTMPLGMIVVRDDFFITVSLRKNKIINFTPIDISRQLKVTNRTIINWCNELMNNGFIKPIIENKRIRRYEVQ